MGKPKTTHTGIFAVEVDHPLRGWVRLDGRYKSRQAARGWYKFIRAVWHGLPLRTVEVVVVTEEVKQRATDGE